MSHYELSVVKYNFRVVVL